MQNYQFINFDTDFKKQTLVYGNKMALQILNMYTNSSLNGQKYTCSAMKGLIRKYNS